EWPPAQALEDFANAEYTTERPNVTVEVNTVPNANWHDAMFTQFAARQTDFDIAILDSQHIGEAVTNGNIVELTEFIEGNIETDAFDPYLLAAYGQYPQAETGKRDESASMYGLPLLGDRWRRIYRKDLIGAGPRQTGAEMTRVPDRGQPANPGGHVDDDLPQGPDRRRAAADLGRDDRGRRAVPGGQPGGERSRLPPGERLGRRRRHVQRGQRPVRREPVGRGVAPDRRRPQRRG